jgi:S-layer protein
MASPTTDDLKKIANLYVALFNRAPDTAGLSFWSSALVNGASLSTISQGFLNAPEGLVNYPATQNAEAFVSAFYQTTFGRAPDAGGLQFWLSALVNFGGFASVAARAQLVIAIADVVSTPLSASDAALPANAESVLDRAMFANKIDYGLYLATQTVLVGTNSPVSNLSLANVSTDPASVVALKAAAVTAQNNGGAAGVISLVATNDVFMLTDAQLAASGFAADGGLGTDTLLLTVSGDIAATPANVLNMEQVTIYTAAGAPASVSIDAARFGGMTSITSASTSNLIISNLAGTQAGVVNGKDAANGSIANAYTTFNYANGVTGAAISVTGATTQGAIAVYGSNLISVGITSNAGPNVLSGISLGSAVSGLSITANTALTIGGGGIAGNTTPLAVVVAGGARVDFGTVHLSPISFNAAGSTGGVAIYIDGDTTRATTVVGSTVADTVRLSGVFGANSNINLGDGNDTLTGEGTTFGAGSVVDGGAGTNTLSFYAVSGTNGAVFQNFQVLDLTTSTAPVAPSVNMTTLAGAGITSLVLAAGSNGGANIQNVTQNLTVTGAAASASAVTTLGLTGAASTSYTISFNAATAGTIEAGSVALTASTGLTIASGGLGTVNKITLTDATLQILAITGATPLQLAFGGATAATSAINASAATGLVTLDTTGVAAAGGGLTITAGTGGLTAIVAQKAEVVLGTGADTVTVKNAGVASGSSADITAKLVTINNFTTGDKLAVGVIAGGSAGTTVYSFTPAGGATVDSLAAAAVTEANAQAVAAKEFASFQLSGDTYLVADINHDGTFGAGDVLVKLAGVVNLTGAVVNVALGTVSL